MNKERKIDGIRIVVNGEQYEAYKGALQDQINELQDRIDKAIEYIENEAIIENLKADHTYITINQDGLLDILKGDNK